MSSSRVVSNVARLKGQALRSVSKRYFQTTASRCQAVAQESTPISNLYHTEPRQTTTSSQHTLANQDSRDTRNTPTASITPFTTRATHLGPLQSDAEHSLAWDGDQLTVSRLRSKEKAKPVSQWWLRDHCPCSICMNQVTKQRNINTLKGRLNAPRIRTAVVQRDSKVLEVEWADGHRSIYEHDFIFRKHSNAVDAIRRGNTPLKLWGSSISSNPPSVPYADIQAGQFGDLTRNIRMYGFCFIKGMPATPEAHESMLRQIGPIRETHFGGFDVVTSDLKSKDTAYTCEALEPHTDTTYFTDGAGLQSLHMLSHEGSGGESLFIDGFNAANQLHEEAPELYQVLATYGIYAHATGNEGVNMQPCDAIPVLRHDHAKTELLQVRWNNADRAGVAAPMDKMDLWYEAASKFQEILNREESRWWFQLKTDTPILFDNWRLLHGRSEFTGKRVMCGGYINHDDYVSKYKTSNYSEADLIAATVSG